MTRLAWDAPESRFFETGLDRGVLYPKTGQAVAWSGLTGVDEEGGETSTPYYIDGRIFLNVPKPKDFAASIKAYTYPNEFAELMGLAEATPGMFLDSQQSDSFGLAYRTLIGDGFKGTEAAYKIHLVYNATVVPDGASYASLSNEVNPSEFSWSIQAVPLVVEGFRPMAHVVIDSRTIPTVKLTALETLLYGDALTTPSLPLPQVIFDLLAFGASIIITDNGDGTWTATGSSANVHMLDVDTFEIENVNATNMGDGTYNITTTIV